MLYVSLSLTFLLTTFLMEWIKGIVFSIFLGIIRLLIHNGFISLTAPFILLSHYGLKLSLNSSRKIMIYFSFHSHLMHEMLFENSSNYLYSLTMQSWDHLKH